jgi:hypothetical protein
MNLQLNNVTIIGLAGGLDPNNYLKALKYSMRKIDFKEAKIIASTKPDDLPDNIQFCQIEPLTHDTVSPWMLYELYKYVDTDYCLTVHDDGFVINPHLWTNEFLNYDYIGAPWKNYGQINRVGNGGFSLRSKKLINLCRNFSYSHGHEDGIICINHKKWLESQNCKFAPVEIAMKFSLESKIPECDFNLDNCFGFHGRGDPRNSCDHDGFYQQFQDKIKLLETL